MKRWMNVRVRTKMALTYAFVIAIFLLEGAVALVELDRVTNDIESLYAGNLASLTGLHDLSRLMDEHRAMIFQHIASNDFSEMQEIAREYERVAEGIDASMQAAAAHAARQPERFAEYQALTAAWRALRAQQDQALALSGEFAKEDAYAKVVAASRTSDKTVYASIDRLREIEKQRADASYQDARAVGKHARVLLAAVIGGGLFVVLFVSVLTVRGIAGRLTGVTLTLVSSAQQISATAEEQSRVLEQQAAAVNEITSTMDELDAAARGATEQSESAAVAAGEVVEQAGQSSTWSREMVRGMAELREQMDAMGRQIMQLSDRMSQIENMTVAVTDIADQTNLLSLNAAVEAARAGESGKGFAVVAQEIRKLAEQSRSFAGKVRGLVDDVQKVTTAAVMVIDDGGKTLETATRSVEFSAEAFETVSGSVGEIADNARQMALSAKQQAGAISQVVESITSINQGVTQSSAGVKQTKVGLENILQITQDLQAMV